MLSEIDALIHKTYNIKSSEYNKKDYTAFRFLSIAEEALEAYRVIILERKSNKG